MSGQPPRRPSQHQPPTPPGGTPPSNREKMKDAVQALVQQVKEQKEQSRAEVAHEKQKAKQKQRRQLATIVILFVALVGAVIYAVPRWSQPLKAPSGEPARQDAKKAIVFAARLLDQYELRSGRLPGTFSQVGVTLPGLVYTRTGDTWTLSMTVDGQPIDYHKGDDPVRFLSSP